MSLPTKFDNFPGRTSDGSWFGQTKGQIKKSALGRDGRCLMKYPGRCLQIDGFDFLSKGKDDM